MGYVCPVCEDPQSDEEHLANHLAFTAMLGDDDHEAWLDEHVPDWAESEPSTLAPRVTAEAEETEFPQVFEDTTGGADHGEHGHSHDESAHGQSHGHGSSQAERQDSFGSVAPDDVDDPSALFGADDADRDPEEVIAEARELTRQQWANAAAEDGEDDDSSASGEPADGDDPANGKSADETDSTDREPADNGESTDGDGATSE